MPLRTSLAASTLLALSILLTSCASSNVSREAASNVDMGVSNAKGLVQGDGDITDGYQNLSQSAKGAIIGGAAGAVAGTVYSGVGFLPGTAAGMILGASYGAYIDSQTSLEDQLENRGVNVVVLGDQILVVVPSARIFNEMTSDIKPQGYSTLALVTQYVNQYTKMLVKVSGYTDASGSQRVNQLLSQEQAQHVAKFMQASGVDARVLYAEGCGGVHLVSKDGQGWFGGNNYRIEITLEKLYV